ncbi:MAG: phytanoyl-CoA dioxygenase family protein [Kiloniellales bacterium]
MTCIDRFQAPTDTARLLDSLHRDGAVILEGVIDPTLCRTIAAEFRPHFDREGDQQMDDFNGYKTLRLNSVLAHAPSCGTLFTEATTIALADACLLENCLTYRIGSATAIEIWPGEDAQRLHRDAHCYNIEIPGMELQVSALWSLTDFTPDNGPTRVIPGSHRWPTGRFPDGSESVAEAVMPAGSALFYLGNTFHGGGANRSDKPRMALINTYSLGWLRQEENMYLSVPPEVAAGLPDDLRRLIGYQGHGLVGWYPQIEDDKAAFVPPVAIAAPVKPRRTDS